MPECDYCSDSFDDEDAYLDHLAAEHEGELGTIDQRRVADRLDTGGLDLPVGPIVLVGLLVFAAVAVAWVVFFMGDGGGSGPTAPAQTSHHHGTINVTIAGEQLDFSREKYQLQADRFHFENREGDVWHGHARRVTLAEAMATLDIEVTNSTVTFEGTTYRDSDPNTRVVVEVNGQPVNPERYVLKGAPEGSPAEEGDHIRILVVTNASG